MLHSAFPALSFCTLSALIFPDVLPVMDNRLRQWLWLESSMTQQLEQYCQHLTVTVVRNEISTERLNASEQRWLPAESHYWRREVILCGDGLPWLMARTLMPASALCGEEKKLLQLSSQPLGHYLFRHANLRRDFILPGYLLQENQRQWGRCSRFRLHDKPLLLTELFLDASPLYSVGKDINQINH